MAAFHSQDIHKLFVDAFNSADVEKLVSLYEAGAILVTAHGKAAGHEAIRETYRHILAGSGQMDLETRTVLDSGDGLALLHGAWTFRRNGYVSSGMSTEVVRRQADGTWLFVLDEPRTPQNAGV